MELPQPQRPFAITNEGKKPTHDFLALYKDSTFPQNDARSAQGFPAFPKTHEFLQPLERVAKSGQRGSDKAEKHTVKEHALPGGIGTYSISQNAGYGPGLGAGKPADAIVPAVSPEAKAETDDSKAVGPAQKNGGGVGGGGGSFYGGGAFTLWQDSGVVGTGASGERPSWTENAVEKPGYGSAENMPNGVASMALLAKNCSARKLVDAVQRPSLPSRQRGQSNQGFVEMMKSVKGASEEDADEEEECMDRSRDAKREGSAQRGDVVVKSDGKSNDQRASTPRSKHSATEQRRRSKINDRFQILRELVPHSDQKRDKASFLLEVIEYIQSLQEKVQKYEGQYPEWDEEKLKLMAWKNSQGSAENNMDNLRAQKSSPSLVFGSKFDDSGTSCAPSIAVNSQNLGLPGVLNTATPFKEKELGLGFPSKPVVPLPIPAMYSPFVRKVLTQPHQRLLRDTENVSTLPQSQSQYWSRSYSIDGQFKSDASQSAGNEREDLVVEGGVINVSSIYSQELLGALTQALQSSGLDLSQANISVQINLGKQSTGRLSTTTSSGKDHEEPSTSNHVMARSRPESSSGGDSEHVRKRLKTERDL